MAAINPDLITDLAEKRAVIFVGAGVSAGVQTRAGTTVRIWGQFLEDAADKLHDEAIKKEAKKILDSKDYLMACELIRRGLGDEEWARLLNEEYHQIGTPSELQKLLMQLQQRLNITTNFDLYLEEAWREANPEATHHPKVVKVISENSFQAFRNSDNYIFKIHGSIDDLSTLIFTKEEYSSKAYGNWAYAKFIETILLTHTVIFVGFSLSDPAIALVIENYAQKIPSARPHYIFLSGEPSEKFIEINKELRRLFIIPYSRENNHQELTDIFRQLVVDVNKRRREIGADIFKALKQG